MAKNSDDAFAEEIAEIFVEEVGEVLKQIDDNLPIWRGNPGNDNALKEVRRGFHTLKGSGRMVHAEEIGELAWAVEGMLNRVIDKSLKVNDHIYEVVQETRKVIPAMIESFRNRQAAVLSGVNFARLIDQAHDIVAGKQVLSIAGTVADNRSAPAAQDHAISPMMAGLDLMDVENIKERVAELGTAVDEMKRSFIRMSTQLDSLSIQIKQMPKSVDPVAITRQLEKADVEIRELKYFMKASSEQMMSELQAAQKRLSGKVDSELRTISDLREQVAEDTAGVTSNLRTDLLNQIRLWSIGSAVVALLLATGIVLLLTP